MVLALWLCVALAVSPDEVVEERAELQERLEAERKAFDALGTEKKELLTLLDTLERLSRDSSSRVTSLERHLVGLPGLLDRLGVRGNISAA